MAVHAPHLHVVTSERMTTKVCVPMTPELRQRLAAEARACGYHFSLAAFIRDAYLAHPPRGVPRARRGCPPGGA
jgi:hypothetical protein